MGFVLIVGWQGVFIGVLLIFIDVPQVWAQNRLGMSERMANGNQRKPTEANGWLQTWHSMGLSRGKEGRVAESFSQP